MNVGKWNEYQQTQDGLIKSFVRRTFYKFLSAINPLFKKRNRILFYESSHLEDSNLTLALYLLRERNYKIYCYNNRILPEEEKYDGIYYFTGLFRLIVFCLTTKVIIETHTQQVKFHPTDNQLVLQLWHGNPIKKSAHIMSNNPKNNLGWYFTKICYSSEFFREKIRVWLGGRDEQMYLNGYPRTDLFFEKNQRYEDEIDFLDSYDKCIMWMPTYRNSSSINLGGRFRDKFPILDKDNIYQLNDLLKSKNVLLLVKLHPLQDEIKTINWNHSNIKRIDNDFLCCNHIQLYYLLSNTDAVITDYSSIALEYTLVNKPIGFAVDDIEQYRKVNGFSFENPEQFFCGMRINNYNELCDFIENICNKEDGYEEERRRVKALSDDYCDGNNCYRIAELIDGYLYG